MSVVVDEVGRRKAEIYEVNEVRCGERGARGESGVFDEEFFNSFYAFLERNGWEECFSVEGN